MDEPIYYISTAFSGVGFARRTEDVPDGATIVARPSSIDPDVRAEGRAWLAAK